MNQANASRKTRGGPRKSVDAIHNKNSLTPPPSSRPNPASQIWLTISSCPNRTKNQAYGIPHTHIYIYVPTYRGGKNASTTVRSQFPAKKKERQDKRHITHAPPSEPHTSPISGADTIAAVPERSACVASFHMAKVLKSPPPQKIKKRHADPCCLCHEKKTNKKHMQYVSNVASI